MREQEVLRRSALAPPPRTLLDVFEQTVRDHPYALAIDDGRRSLTCPELAAEVQRVGGELGHRHQHLVPHWRRVGHRGLTSEQVARVEAQHVDHAGEPAPAA